MSSIFRVWVEIEEETDKGDYIDHGMRQNYSSSAIFDTYEEAEACAEAMHKAAGADESTPAP